MLDKFEVQPTKMREGDIEALKEVDSIIGKAVTIGDPLIAFSFGARCIAEGMTRGKMLAKLLYNLDQSWPLFVQAGVEDDLETMAFVHMGVRPQTTKKYIDMWRSIAENNEIPEAERRTLLGRPISDLLLLAPGIRDGSLTEDDIHEAAYASDTETVKSIIRSRRGTKTSAGSAIRIYVQMQNTANTPAGTIYAKQGRKKTVIGMRADKLDELGEKAWARLVKYAGIVEVYVGG